MTSYLIVNEWRGEFLKGDAPTLFRRVEARGEKARQLARDYARELNDNVDFALDKIAQRYAIINNRTWYTVVAVPPSQARERADYLSRMDEDKCPLLEVKP